MSDSDKTVFVNRHGKKTSVNGTQLGAMPAAQKPVPAVSPKVRVKRKKRPIKKVLLALIIVIFLLLLVPIVGGEIVRARYVSSLEGTRTSLKEYATQTVLPEQKKQLTLAQLTGAAAKTEAIRDGACDGGLTDNLATIYPRANTALRDCIALKLKVATIASSLRELESQVRYLERLAPVLEPVSRPTTDEFAVISAQLANWQALHEALGALSPAASQRQAHEQLKLHAKAIVDAWSSLNSAYSAEDAKSFSDAEKKLAQSYETFRSSSSTLLSLMKTSQSKLITSYKAL